MRIFTAIMLVTFCVLSFFACGCRSMAHNNISQIKKGMRVEDVLQTCKDAKIIRSPVGDLNGCFLLRIETDKYCAIDVRGLVAGIIEKEYDISEKGGTEGARYSVADEKMLKEYVELTHNKYVGRNIVEVLKTQGRLIYASGYDVSWISSGLAITLDGPKKNEKRILEIKRYAHGVSVAEFVIAIEDKLWLVLLTDSNGTIVESEIQDILPIRWIEWERRDR